MPSESTFLNTLFSLSQSVEGFLSFATEEDLSEIITALQKTQEKLTDGNAGFEVSQIVKLDGKTELAEFIIPFRRLIFLYLNSDSFVRESDEQVGEVNLRAVDLLVEVIRMILDLPEVDQTLKEVLFKGDGEQEVSPSRGRLLKHSISRTNAITSSVMIPNEMVKGCFYRAGFCGKILTSPSKRKEKRGKEQVEEEVELLRLLMHSAYQFSDKSSKKLLRALLGNVLQLGRTNEAVQQHVMELRLALEVTGQIVKGFSKPLSVANLSLLRDLLLPLHGLQGKITEQKPTLSLIHKDLIFCLLSFLDKQPELMTETLQCILKSWPDSWAGNTPKEILLLNELESCLEHPAFHSKLFQTVIGEKVLQKLVKCLSSDHSVVCEKALLLWQNSLIYAKFIEVHEIVAPTVVRVLLEKCIRHWNQTVKKMTALVLKAYSEEAQIKESFLTLARQVLDLDGNTDDTSSSFETVEIYLKALFQEHGLSAQNGEQGEHQRELAKAKAIEASIAKGIFIPAKELDLTVMNMVLGDEIGHGSFGSVFVCYKVVKGKTRSQWNKYAVKEISLEHEVAATRELSFMNEVSHPNCLALIGYYKTSSTVNLVMEYAEKGDLHSILVEYLTLDVMNIRFLSGEVIAALDYFHVRDLVFGDLKPENVLIFGNNHAKLCDFGAVRKVEELQKGAPLEGTFIYLAPELAQGESGSLSSDYWSLGCLVYQMLFGKPPFKLEKENLVLTNPSHSFLQSNTSSSEATSEDTPFKVESLNTHNVMRQDYVDSRDAHQLVMSLLTRSPEKRLGALGMKQVYDHAFFSRFQSQSLIFEDLHQQTAPELAAGSLSFQKNVGSKIKGRHNAKSSGANNSAWTQRSYSMMISPVPKKYSFDEKPSAALKLIPENPGEENLSWTSKSSRAQTGAYLSMDGFRNFKVDLSKIPILDDLQAAGGKQPSFWNGQGLHSSGRAHMAIPKISMQSSALKILQRNNMGNPNMRGLAPNRPRGGLSRSMQAASGGTQKQTRFVTVAPHLLPSHTKQTNKKENSKKAGHVVNDIDPSAG